jgi:hypothetical protein
VNGATAPLLQALEQAGEDDWATTVELAPQRVHGQLANTRLREVIRGEPHIGAAASSFL